MRESIRQFIASCEAGLVTEGQIRGIRRTITRYTPTAHESGLEDIAHKLGNPYVSPIDAVYNAVNEHEPLVTHEQMLKGREWLLANTFTASSLRNYFPLKLRKNAYLTAEQAGVVKMAHCARLVSFDNVGIVRDEWVPVYRYETNSLGMEYCAASWQSGITGDQVTGPHIVALDHRGRGV